MNLSNASVLIITVEFTVVSEVELKNFDTKCWVNKHTNGSTVQLNGCLHSNLLFAENYPHLDPSTALESFEKAVQKQLLTSQL